ncbi:MAG: Lon protease family protein [Bacillota bacterium]
MMKLSAEKLRCVCLSEELDFKTTDDLEKYEEDIIGQRRAVEAVDFGCTIDREGYNIFMAGIPGTGKKTYAKKIANKKANQLDTPDDLIYIFNFSDSENPKALTVPAGRGKHLKEEMERVVEELKEEIPNQFEGEEFEEKRSEIMAEYQRKSNKMMEDFDQEIREEGFMLQNTKQGPVPVPLDQDGEPLDQEDYQKYDDEKRQEIRNKSQDIKKRLEKLLRKIREMKEDAQEEMDELQSKMGLAVVQPIIDQLKHRFSDCGEEVIEYFNDVQEDILENLDQFMEDKKESQLPFPVQFQDGDSFLIRYKVNLLVDNSKTEGGPVIHETNPTYYNLFGKIEGKSQMGTITTDFTMIKAGAVHKANGGYLVLQARDVLTNPFSWETLKRALINQELKVENIGEQYRTFPISSLKPEAFDIDVKVILIGNPYIYRLLYHYDEEFKKLFKVKAHFDVEMKRNAENMKKFAKFVASVCEREGLKHFTVDAVSKIIEYSSRLTGDTKKMSTRFNKIMELLYESNTWAELEENEFVVADNIVKAIDKKEDRSNLIEEKIQEMIERDHLMIDVTGEEKGQINGLSVYQNGEYSFGRPSRITCQTYLGQEGVVNIEREAKMSGKIHDKGVLILSGYLGGKYAQEKPLSLSASIAFEQSYSGVDGDSASCAELLTIISSVTGLPLRQDLAITGSMNQRGIVQPIGGVNHKIEGFYQVCKSRDLTGEQGVVIPEQNKENLMLKDEIVDSVESGEFNVYTITDVDEAIELFFDKPAEEVHAKVKETLEEMAENIKEMKAGDKKETEETEESNNEEPRH